MINPLNLYQSRFLLESNRRKALDNTDGAVFGRPHVMYKDFLNQIASFSRKPINRMSKLGEYILLKNVLNKMDRKSGEERKTILSILSRFRGFLDILTEIIYEFSEADMDLKELEKALSGENLKLSTLISIATEYQSAMQEKSTYNLSEIKKIAVLTLQSRLEIPFLDDYEEIHFRNIYPITNLDLRLILELAEYLRRKGRYPHGQIYIHLPYDTERQDVFRYLEDSILKMELLGDSAPDNLNLCFQDEYQSAPKAETSCALKYLRRNIFGNRPEPITEGFNRDDPSVHIINSTTAEAEVNSICREIRNLLEQGVSPGNIGVCFRSLSNYGPLLYEAERRFDIPFIFPRGNPLLFSHLIKTLLLPFHIIQKDYPPDLVIRFVSSPYIDSSILTGGQPINAGLLEKTASKAGIVDNRLTPWIENLKKYEKSGDKLTDGKQSENIETPDISPSDLICPMMESLFDMFSPLTEKSTISAYTGFLRSLVKRFDIEKRIMKGRVETDPALAIKILQGDLSALENLLEILDFIDTEAPRMGIVEGEEEEISRKDFYNILMEGIRVRNLAPPYENDGIAVLDTREMTGLQFTHLFLGGLSEGVFPARQMENVLFGDDERQALREKISSEHLFTGPATRILFANAIQEKKWDRIHIFQSSAIKQWEEHLLFYLSIASAGERIYFTRNSIDKRGNACLPSYFLEECRRILPGFVEKKESPIMEILPPPESIKGKRELTERLIYDLWKPSREDKKGSVLLFLNTLKKHDPEEISRLSRIFSHCTITEELEKSDGNIRSGIINSPQVLDMLREHWKPDHLWSAGRLEKYGECPFKYFIENILEIEELPTPEIEISALLFGNLIHRILKEFYAGLITENRLPLKGDESEKSVMIREIRKYFAVWEKEYNIGLPLLYRLREKKVIKELLRWLETQKKVQQETGMIPVLLEQDFGSKKDCFIEDFSGGKIFFTGRFDRIDISPDGGEFRVIDYKSGKSEKGYSSKKLTEKIGSSLFQPPVYTIFAEKMLKSRGLLKAENPKKSAIYDLPRINHTGKISFSDGEMEEYLSRIGPVDPDERCFINDVTAIIEKITGGIFPPPGPGCKFCKFDTICRKNSLNREEAGDSENDV